MATLLPTSSFGCLRYMLPIIYAARKLGRNPISDYIRRHQRSSLRASSLPSRESIDLHRKGRKLIHPPRIIEGVPIHTYTICLSGRSRLNDLVSNYDLISTRVLVYVLSSDIDAILGASPSAFDDLIINHGLIASCILVDALSAIVLVAIDARCVVGSLLKSGLGRLDCHAVNDLLSSS